MDDSELLSRYLGGADGAFEEIVRRYSSLVFSAARRQVRSPESAEDVTQAVFIVLARKAHRVTGQNLPGWLVKTAWYAATNALIAERRRKHREQEAAKLRVNTEWAGDEMEIAEVVDGALSHLRDADRAVITRHYLREESLAEIARVMGQSEDTVRRRLSRAIVRLRKALPAVGMTDAMLAARLKGLDIANVSPEIMKALSARALGASGSGLAGAILKSMAWAKAKFLAICLLGAITAGAAGTIILRDVLLTDDGNSAAAAPVPAAPTGALSATAISGANAEPNTVVYHGVVWNNRCRPVGNVRVICAHVVDNWASKRNIESETRTAEDGSFSIGPVPPADFRNLVFIDPDYGVAWCQAWPNGLKHPVIRLQPADSLSGVVTDSTGKPVPGAAVFPEVNDRHVDLGNGNNLALAESTGDAIVTDSGGRFTVTNLPVGSHVQLRVNASGYPEFHSRYESQAISGNDYSPEYFPYSAGDQDVRVVLNQGGSIRVRLKGEINHRLGVVTVRAICNEGFSGDRPVDTNGTCLIGGLVGGQWNIQARISKSDDEMFYWQKSGISVEPGKTIDATIDIPKMVTISGTIAQAVTKRPLANTRIEAFADGNTPDAGFVTVSDGQGHFSTAAPARSYAIMLLWGHGERQLGHIAANYAEAAVHVNLQIKPPDQVRLRLVDERHMPVAGKVFGGGPVSVEQSGLDGRVEIEPLLNPYEKSYAVDDANSMGAKFNNSQTAANLGDIVLRPMIHVTGQIVDRDGRPDPDADVAMTQSIPGGMELIRLEGSIEIKADGRFSIRCVPGVDGFGFYFKSPAGYAEKKHIANAAGGQINLGRVRLSGSRAMNDATISGRLLDEDGKPIVGAALQSLHGDFDGTRTDHRGWFILTDLPYGQRITIWMNSGDKSQVFTDVTTGQQNLELRMKPRGYQLLGKPAPEFTVEKWLTPGPANLAELRGKVVLLQLGAALGDGFDDQIAPVMEAARKYDNRSLQTLILHEAIGPSTYRFVDNKMVLTKEEDVAEYVAKHGIRIPFAMDASARSISMDLKDGQYANGATYATYYCQGAGEMFLIDKNGNVAACPQAKDLDAAIEKLLDQ